MKTPNPDSAKNPPGMHPGRVLRERVLSGAAPPKVYASVLAQQLRLVLLDQPERGVGVEGVHGGSSVGQCTAGRGTQVQSG